MESSLLVASFGLVAALLPNNSGSGTRTPSGGNEGESDTDTYLFSPVKDLIRLAFSRIVEDFRKLRAGIVRYQPPAGRRMF